MMELVTWPRKYETHDPKVACVCLTRNRPQMFARAVESFKAQTYQNRRLVVVNTSDDDALGSYPLAGIGAARVWTELRGQSVGKLRNEVNALAEVMGADIIAHWDDDDWSHPLRLEEQVSQLIHSGAPAVGYNTLLFWKTNDPFPGKIHPKCEGGPAGLACVDGVYVACPKCGGSQICDGVFCHPDDRKGEAWLYRNTNPAQPCGTSLLYWLEAWRMHPWRDMTPSGAEDHEWIGGLRPYARAISSIPVIGSGAPRMIASIHGSNTNSRIVQCLEWQRVSGYDGRCREVMGL